MAESPSPAPAVRLRHLRSSRGVRPAARPESPVSGGGLPTTIGVFALLRYRHSELDDRALHRLLHQLLPMARGLARFVDSGPGRKWSRVGRGGYVFLRDGTITGRGTGNWRPGQAFFALSRSVRMLELRR